MIKGGKIRVYDLNIIVFNESTIKLIAAGLSLDFDTYDLSLIEESDGLSRIINNVDLKLILDGIKEGLLNINNVNPNLYRVSRSGKRLLGLVKTNNTKNTNIDIGRVTYSGLVGALTRIAIVINNASI